MRNHIDRLVRLEYIAVHHGGYGQRFVYELLVDDEAGPASITTATSHASEGHLAASNAVAQETVQPAHLDAATKTPSYPKTRSYRMRRGNGRDHART